MLPHMDSVSLSPLKEDVYKSLLIDPKLSRLLVQHPNVLTKLRDEVKGAIGVGPEAPDPTINQVKTLSYLSLVIKEGN